MQNLELGKNGPGLNFWKVIKDNFPTLPFLAEDLGLITKEVRQLREQIPLLGMAVLQFAFDGDSKNLYLPHNLNKSLVLYSGTHDNDTTIGWYSKTHRMKFRIIFALILIFLARTHLGI